MKRLLAVATLALFVCGCATTSQGARREWVLASAADSVSTYVALRDGARETNPIYASLDGDPGGVAAASFAASLAVGWLIERAVERIPRHKRPNVRRMVLSIRWIPVPLNANTFLKD